MPRGILRRSHAAPPRRNAQKPVHAQLIVLNARPAVIKSLRHGKQGVRFFMFYHHIAHSIPSSQNRALAVIILRIFSMSGRTGAPGRVETSSVQSGLSASDTSVMHVG